MAKPTIILINTFRNAAINEPDFTSSKVSKLKVEKVLRPPQNPITKNSLRLFSILSVFDLIQTKIKAKIRQLSVFDINVATGKFDLK